MLPEDAQLDAASNNPGQQQFEKLTAGLYMGDIARRIILRQPPSSASAMMSPGSSLHGPATTLPTQTRLICFRAWVAPSLWSADAAARGCNIHAVRGQE